jgi:hypothetical protein
MAIDTIGTNALATGAVNTSKIASSAVDDSTIEIASNQLQLKDGGITNAKVAANAAIVQTKVSGLDTLTANLENEVGLLNINRLIDNGAALDDFVKGFSDAFVDESGVDTGNNVNMTYDSATDTYAAPNGTTISQSDIGASNTNWAGQTSNWNWGQYTDSLGVYSSGNFGVNIRTGIYYNVDQSATGDIVEFSMEDTTNTGIVAIYEAAYQSHWGDTARNHGNAGMFSSSSTHWQNGDPQAAGVKAMGLRIGNGTVGTLNVKLDSTGSVSYTTGDVFAFNRASDGTMQIKKNGSVDSTLTNAINSTYGVIANDWQVGIWHQGEGLSLNLSYLKIRQEVDSGVALAGTFLTNAQTATSQPDTIRLVAIGKEVDSQTLNTDTVFSVSRDGGTTFTNITMTESGNYNSSGVKIYTGTADVSSQPTGTSVVLKKTTDAGKKFTLHGYSLLYK